MWNKGSQRRIYRKLTRLTPPDTSDLWHQRRALPFRQLVPSQGPIGLQAMAIYRQLSQASFGPDAVRNMTEAYECVLKQLHMKDRDDPITELIAAKIIQVFRLGETDPRNLCDRTIKELGVQPR
jgi:hypothetical protein